jgi:hypothetical protein
MSELAKTAVFVVVAVFLLAGASYVGLSRPGVTDATFKDQGQRFFPDFDPNSCTSLEVVQWDSDNDQAYAFRVMFKDGKWVIPSHFDYPADAKDRLAKTAGALVGITKDSVRSDRTEDQEPLGVVDPLDTASTSVKGRGKHVTLRDKSDKVLADLIIGKAVEGHTDQHYVRVPNQKRIYAVNVTADLSTKFSDWIETNLLKLESSKIRRVKFDNYKVDPERGRIIPGKVTTIERPESFGTWNIVGELLDPSMEMNTEKLQSLTNALADLKIVGVRPKPAGLTKDLTIKGAKSIDEARAIVGSLVARGFYPGPEERLYSNQGDVVVSTDEGVVYTIRFGEIFTGSGIELTAGTDEAEKKGAEKKKGAKKTAEETENRYVMVTVAFDPSLLPPEHPKDTEPTGPLTIPDDPFQRLPTDPTRIAEEKAEKEKLERETKAHEQRIADGQKKVNELGDRFAGWYYVTPGDSFHAIALKREDLTKKKESKPAGSPPSLPGTEGLPGGLPGFGPPR